MKKKLIVILLVVALVLGSGLVPVMPVSANPGPTLVARWNFDDNANDSSGNNNNGTVFGATYVAGKFDKALKFDGIHNRVEVPHSTSLNISGTGITLEAWINAEEFPAPGRDITINKTGAYALQVADGGKVRVWLGPITPMVETDAVVLLINTWYHIAGTFDGSNVRIYVDGILIKTVAKTGNQATSTNPLIIGKRDPGTTNTDGAFKGLIDEVRIWATALTTTQLDDMTPPIITKTKTPTDPDGQNGWYTNNVPITLNATDAGGSGVKEIRYILNSGSTVVVPGATANFIITDEGKNTLEYWAVDYANNVGSLQTQDIYIDKTLPTLSKTKVPTDPDGQNGWYISNVEVTLTGDDPLPGSGLEKVEYNLNDGGWTLYNSPFTISTDGVNTLKHRAYDKAGNEFVLTTQDIKIDKTSPEVTGVIDPLPNAAGWNNSDVTITWSASDPESGISSGPTPATETVTTEGANQNFAATAINGAGLTATGSVIVNLDKTPPVVQVTLPGTGVYLVNEEVYATWLATDTLSGVVPPNTETILLDTSSAGLKTLTVPAGTAIDNAGNESSEVTVTYSVKYGGFKGLLSPYVAPPKGFKLGSSIPLKWQYTDINSAVVDSSLADPVISIVFVNSSLVEVPIVPIGDPGDSGLRYDATTNMWIFNWQTKGLTAGTYRIRITSVQTGQVYGPFPIQLIR